MGSVPDFGITFRTLNCINITNHTCRQRWTVEEIMAREVLMNDTPLLITKGILTRGGICSFFNPYPTAFPYGNGMVLHFYQQQESSTTKTVHKVINKGLKAYV